MRRVRGCPQGDDTDGISLGCGRLIYGSEIGHEAADHRADSNSDDCARGHKLCPVFVQYILSIDDCPVRCAPACADSDANEQMMQTAPSNLHALYIAAFNGGVAALFQERNAFSIHRDKSSRHLLVTSFNDTNLVALLKQIQILPNTFWGLAPRRACSRQQTESDQQLPHEVSLGETDGVLYHDRES